MEKVKAKVKEMGSFTGIGEAKVGAGGVYFLEGTYQVEVLKVFTMRSRQKDDLFIVECRILESENEKRPAGTKASWVVSFKHDSALGNIKGFVAAANGIDPNDDERVTAEVTEEAVEMAVSDDNPLQGLTMGLVCTMVSTKAGNPFTRHDWEPVTAE